MRRTSERSAMFPITLRRASRQHDWSRRPSASRKSPSPKSSRLARRFAVSIRPSGGMRRLTLPLNIAPNRLRARMAIGARKRLMVASDCIGRDVPVARSRMQAQASEPINLSDEPQGTKNGYDFPCRSKAVKLDGLKPSSFCGTEIQATDGRDAVKDVPISSAAVTVSNSYILPTACCTTHPSVSSLLHGNGQSDLWCRLFLGSGRDLSQIKRRDRYSGRLRRWQQGQSNL